MKLSLPTLYLILVSIFGFGCSSGLKGKPVDGRTSLEAGVVLVATPVGGCIVRAGVREINKKRLVMVIEVINQMREVIPMKAVQFLVKGSALKDGESVSPMDPETTIASASASIELLEERMHPSLFSVLGNIPENIAMESDPNREPASVPLDNKTRLAQLRGEKARWEREAFRDGELLEMSRTKGFLLFDGEFGRGSFHLVSRSAKCPADLLFEVD